MIPSLIEELIIIFYLIIYGIFLLSTYDILLFVIRGWKKLYQIIGQIIFTITTLFITIKFSYHLHNGYIPLIFPIFLALGAVLYLLFFKKTMIVGLSYLKQLYLWIKKPVKKMLIYLFYPKEALYFLSYPLRKMKETLKLFKLHHPFKKSPSETDNNQS